MKLRNAFSTATPNVFSGFSSRGTLAFEGFAIESASGGRYLRLTKLLRQERLCYFANQEVTMASPIRRVVTGKDATGKAVAILDDVATSVHRREELGVTNTLLWVTDSNPADLSSREDTANRKIGITPPAGGTILRVIEFAPETEVKADYETRLRNFQALGVAPEGESRQKPRHPAMHRTRTIDYALILSGEIDMLLDDSEIHLKAGDVVIQRGTNHAWVNRGKTPCRVAAVLVDAKD
jgi:mannose-6-phosphate isomerase-like protein (cupin superfamily)